jgi:hypothetical protein
LIGLTLVYFFDPGRPAGLRFSVPAQLIGMTAYFVCMYLIHTMYQPQIFQALKMMFYLYDHAHKFENSALPASIAGVRILLIFAYSLLNMFGCIYNLGGNSNEFNLVLCFAAFSVIS